MGWDFHHEIAPYDRRAICRRDISDKYEVVKDAVVGTTYYAALRCKETGVVHALIVLTRIDRNDYCNFGMKWLGEDSGPFECDCPKAILELLSPTDNKYALEWREACWAKVHEPKDDTLRKAEIGTTLRVWLGNGDMWLVEKRAPAFQFKTWWLKTVHGLGYIPKSKVVRAEYV